MSTVCLHTELTVVFWYILNLGLHMDTSILGYRFIMMTYAKRCQSKSMVCLMA